MQRTLRNGLPNLPMFGQFAAFQPEDVDDGETFLSRLPLRMQMHDDEISVGKNAFHVSPYKGKRLPELPHIGFETIRTIGDIWIVLNILFSKVDRSRFDVPLVYGLFDEVQDDFLVGLEDRLLRIRL